MTEQAPAAARTLPNADRQHLTAAATTGTPLTRAETGRWRASARYFDEDAQRVIRAALARAAR